MPKRVAVVLTLSTKEREELEQLSRRHTTAQQVAQRARIVLRAAAGENNTEIGRALGMDVDTVRAWRARWSASQAVSRTDLSLEERLRDRPRSGRKAEIQSEEVMRRGIVKRISPRHAARLLKRGI
jgi:DNA-binding CsgD family transcriptional regulator